MHIVRASSSISLENFKDRAMIIPEILELIKMHTCEFGLVYNIVNNESPSYLSDLLPNRVDRAANNNLRNSENFQVRRLCVFDSSFFPATLRLWND